jgi:hypothetical protein
MYLIDMTWVACVGQASASSSNARLRQPKSDCGRKSIRSKAAWEENVVKKKKGEKPTYRWQAIRMTTLATRQFVASASILPSNLPRLSGSDLLLGV